VLPAVLSVHFHDPVVIDQVDGQIGSARFEWQLHRQQFVIHTSNDDQQGERVKKAWDHMRMLGFHQNRRVLAALGYFHAASRLSRVGHSPWEFMGEIILNLNKTLEVLFPPHGDVKRRDAVRQGLAKLDYTDAEIEADFIPVMLLRSSIDSGHAFLDLFTQEELTTMQTYTEAIEENWLRMLAKLLDKLESDSTIIDDYKPKSADREPKKLVATIAKIIQQRHSTPPSPSR
jgi:hypothetical protein